MVFKSHICTFTANIARVPVGHGPGVWVVGTEVPAGSMGRAPVWGLRDKVPQLLNHFVYIDIKF